MPHLNSRSRPPLLTASVLLPILASLLLAACGNSSSTSASTSAAATGFATTAAAGPVGARKRFEGVRACLQNSGIVLPKRAPGQRPSAGGRFLGGEALQLPKGVTLAQYRTAIKKCVDGLPGVTRAGGRVSRIKSPVFKQALAKFAACLRANGFNIPALNTSGKGPILNTSGLNLTGPKFKAAQTKCAGIMRSAFKASPGRPAG